ncbi:hypothetical protein [Mycobacterium sp. DL99]|nr:hypothetical protein [Mycobacterium sp. DL99]
MEDNLTAEGPTARAKSPTYVEWMSASNAVGVWSENSLDRTVVVAVLG